MRTPIAKPLDGQEVRTYRNYRFRANPYESTRHYIIMNLSSGYILVETDDLAWAKRMWRKIPRRKTCTLILMDNETGEILKTKPPRGCDDK